uniref:Uncharacterized protein n=1 Tax=Vespula pensylvanica TaxID=30213 RepID=A0A834UFZ7_VESPE|nr:hypothetical protein H0235_004141 [Vespula pensylvanica]
MAIGKVVPLKALSTSPASPIPYSVPNKSHTCLGNSSVREYQRNRIYKSTFVAIEWSNIRVKMDFGDKDKVSVLFHQIRVSASKKIIEDIFPRIIAGVDVDLAHFQPTTDQPISISTYTADECFGAIGELPK